MPQNENFPPVNLQIKSDTEMILEQQAEIQRLTKEVEELKKDKESLEKQAATFSHVHKMLNDRIKEDAKEIESLQKAPKIGTDCKKELTRLRSLLERCKSVLDPSNRYYTNLLSDIDEATKQ